MSNDENEGSTSRALLDHIDAVAPEGWKAKLGLVTTQLLAGTKWGAEYYQRVREVKDFADGRSKVNALVAEAVGKQAIADPEIMNRAKARFIGGLYQKQENVEAVIAQSAVLLEHSPPPQVVNESNSNASPLDSDWASAFMREAECATSDELRDRLARVLAGEMTQSGTYSRSTLRIIAELDRQSLENFKLVLSKRVGDVLVITKEWNERERLPMLLEAEAAGFVVNAAAPLRRELTAVGDGRGFLLARKYLLLIEGLGDQKIHISIVKLTRDGQAIANLICDIDEREGLKIAFQEVNKESISSAFIAKYERKDQGYTWEIESQIWPTPDTFQINPFQDSPLSI